jgi:hypothetical protein
MEKPTKVEAIQLLKQYYKLSEYKRLTLAGVVNLSLTYEQKVSRVNSVTYKLLDISKKLDKVDMRTLK